MLLDKIAYFLVITLAVGCTKTKKKSDNHICQNRVIVAEEQTKLLINGGLVLYQDKPFCGTTEAYYPNEQLAETIDYCEGKREGRQHKWFPDGKKAYECGYENNLLHGDKKSWWSNGNIRSEAFFDHGTITGKVTEWYHGGEKFKELNYKNGVEHGMQHGWRQNGKLYINYEAKNGRIYGLKRTNLCYSLEDEEVQFTK